MLTKIPTSSIFFINSKLTTEKGKDEGKKKTFKDADGKNKMMV